MFSRKFRTCFLTLAFSLFSFVPVIAQNLPTGPAAKLLPEKLGEFRPAGSVASPVSVEDETHRRLGITSWAARDYVSKDGQRFSAMVMTTISDSAAYAQLTERRRFETSGIQGVITDAGVGTASFSYSDGKRNHLCFFKGRVSASLEEYGGKDRDIRLLMNLANTLAETIDKGEGDIPVLVKHLPDWQNVQPRVLYAVNRDTLKNAFSNQSVLDVVTFEGGAEAVVANYDSGKLLIIEFNTPRIAGDNDWNIRTKINELRSPNQPIGNATPTAYRRVGNYSVFVFDAPNEQAANQLIDQVKYQQVVQWLGENPFLYEEATREFTETTLGVFVTVVKASGLALVSCFALGGFVGGLLFIRRRSQQRGMEAYSDAGGMVRLNLDEMTPESDPARLLGRGN